MKVQEYHFEITQTQIFFCLENQKLNTHLICIQPRNLQ